MNDNVEFAGIELPDFSTVAETTEAPPTENLSGIGMLSYATPESICGDDSRVQVTCTTTGPYYFICSVVITMPDDSRYIGSGWLANTGVSNPKNNVIMTSGHVVFADGKFAKSITVYPGRNGSKTPYGSYTVDTSGLRASQQWQQSGNSDYDYGAILIPKSTANLGGLGWALLSDSDLQNRIITNAGYPGDKPSGTIWETGGEITAVTSNKIQYMNDTFGGQSGSPAWTWYNGYWTVVGIHGYGGCPNKAVRMKIAYQDMKTWANA